MKFDPKLNDPTNLYYFSNGFSDLEVELIRVNAANSLPQRATIDGENQINQSIRESRLVWLANTAEWSWVFDRMRDMIIEANSALWRFDLVSGNEYIQYTEYEAINNGHYDWHMDIGAGQACLRKISMTIQLSDPEEYSGGDLEIWQGGTSIIRAHKHKGFTIVFPSYLMHRVTPVTSGIRRSLVIWVGGSPLR